MRIVCYIFVMLLLRFRNRTTQKIKLIIGVHKLCKYNIYFKLVDNIDSVFPTIRNEHKSASIKCNRRAPVLKILKERMTAKLTQWIVHKHFCMTKNHDS